MPAPVRRADVSDELIGQALAQGWTVAQIAGQLGCSAWTIYMRIRQARDKYGFHWGGTIAVPTCEDPAAELRARLLTMPPSFAEVRAIATHAVAWGLEQGTATGAQCARAGLMVLESPEFQRERELESEEVRRKRALEVIVQALSAPKESG